MQDLPDKIDSKFRFVLLAAARAEQIMRGAEPKTAVGEKHTSAAMQEIRSDLIEWDYGFQEEPPAIPAVGEEEIGVGAEEPVAAADTEAD
ncbi:MAG: DNA-directed RNA polymerase subunit omega [Acidobacteriota bacterium]